MSVFVRLLVEASYTGFASALVSGLPYIPIVFHSVEQSRRPFRDTLRHLFSKCLVRVLEGG